jgi:hypothetical protein
MWARRELAAELLPGDVVSLEGMTLEIEDVVAGRDFIGLEFVDLDWTLIVDRESLIHTVSRVCRFAPDAKAAGGSLAF